MTSVEHITKLNLESLQRGKLHRLWYDIISDPFGKPMSVPLLIGRGSLAGPVLGVTAAVHGNELNGIPVIQRLFKEIARKKIRGTVVGIPVVNVPGFMRKQRRFVDNVDLNHVIPGKRNGTVSQVYAYRFFRDVVSQFDYLVDLHTASTGRINSYYIRANMDVESTRKLALLQNADIIVHNPASDGTLRGAAEGAGIPAITLEVGNPSTFQRGMIRSGLTGLHNVLIYLKMCEGKVDEPKKKPLICKNSYWLYTERGGLLSVLPELRDKVLKDQVIARQFNIFGDKIKDYRSPESGVVIGKSVSPVDQTGGRILHLGIL